VPLSLLKVTPSATGSASYDIRVGAEPSVTIWHNPRCSKSRGALALLAEHGVDPRIVRYLDETPSRAGLLDVLRRLGTDDPRTITRTGEPRYRELGLSDADSDTLLDALVANPILIERPIVLVGERAVVARPPERALELLEP
jgi:arsenate reductase